MTMSNVRPRIDIERLFCIKVSSSTMVNRRSRQWEGTPLVARRREGAFWKG